MEPGNTYFQFGLFYEIPEGVRIARTGGAAGDQAYEGFAEVTGEDRWTELLVDFHGNEAPPPIGRWIRDIDDNGEEIFDFEIPLSDAENEMWDRFLANIRTTPFPDGDTRNEPPAPLAANARPVG